MGVFAIYEFCFERSIQNSNSNSGQGSLTSRYIQGYFKVQQVDVRDGYCVINIILNM